MNGRAQQRKLASSTRRSNQMQNVTTLVSRRVPFGTAAVSGLLAFAAGIAIAAATPVVVGGLTTGPSSTAIVSAPAAGLEQDTHNRYGQEHGDDALEEDGERHRRPSRRSRAR